MARPSKKGLSVYERIEQKKNEIKETEETLARLNDELKVLFQEQDDLEMHQMLEQIRANGIDINQALELLANKKTK